MFFDVEQHVLYQIASAPMRVYPFPHLYVPSVFPKEFYPMLLENLPPLESYTCIADSGKVTKGAYKERFIYPLFEQTDIEAKQNLSDFWRATASWLLGQNFFNIIFGKFHDELSQRFGDNSNLSINIDACLARDFTNFSLPPHTDTYNKLFSVLFYLPREASHPHLGTSIFTPNDPNFRCSGKGAHHPFNLFKKTATMEYVPNSVLIFYRTDNSFHGVDTVIDQNVQRDLLLYNIYVNEAPRITPVAV